MNLIQIALKMRRAHRGQTRMDGCTPYECHPWDVAERYAEVYGEASLTDTVAAAILLHDVVEDCSDEGYDEAWLRSNVPAEVAELVMWLTKPKRPPGVDKLTFTKALYAKLGREGPVEARQIKVADRLCNLSDTKAWTDDFRRVYIADTHHLTLSLAGTPGIERVERRLYEIREGLA